VYAWIWRHLPFGRPGKLVGSVLLALAAVALLWFVVFPAIDPHLPFNNDGQVTGQFTQPGQDTQPTQSTQPRQSIQRGQSTQPGQDSVVPASPTPTH
jgi:hypothetical protein